MCLPHRLFCVLLISTFAILDLPAQQGNPAPPAPSLVIASVDDGVRTTLSGNVHPLAQRAFDQGEAHSDLSLDRMLIVLKRSPQQEAALQRLLEDQQDIHSTAYHQWLTPQQFGERFGPSNADIGAVTQWLNASGFQVSQISKSRVFVEFSGSASQVKQAFGTPIHSFVVDGEQHWANVADPSVPAALAPVIAGIDSLHNFQKQAQHTSFGTYAATGRQLLSPSPAYTILGGSGTEYPVTPYDFATIYDLLPLWATTPTAINGAGQTIAIVGRSDINRSDAPSFWSFFDLDGVHAPEPTLIVTYNGPNPGINSDESEADIDTQWSGAVAPGSTINLVTSKSTSTTDGVDLSALYIVDNNLAPVMSESYGECEKSLGSGGIQFYGSLWQQAAAQGISVFVSSGDSGAAGCDSPSLPAKSGLQVNGIASTPFNAAVGGTDFNQYQNGSTYWNATNAPITQESAKRYIPETTWNDSCTNELLQFVTGGSSNAEDNCNSSTFSAYLNSTGGSGGPSSSWLKPNWQTGTLSDNARDLPDVSLFAGNGFLGSYYYICQSDLAEGDCQNQGYQGFGGTSVASPQFAGIMALINQVTGSPQGIPGLILYKLAAQQPAVFHDIPTGSTISMPCATATPNCVTSRPGDIYGLLSGYSTSTGYDLATGLGSVDVANLVKQWQTISFTSSATALTLNGGAPINIAHGAALPFSIAVTPSAATGEAALMVAPVKPGDPGIDAFPLASGSAAASTTMLPGGSYSVLAHYSGDSTYGGSYSNSVPVNVTAETSTTFANLVTTSLAGVPTSFAASNATYGSGFLSFRVDVGDAAASVSPASGISSLCANSKESCPTGKVSLKAPGTALDGVVLVLNSKGSAEVPAPPPGSYAVTATYSGDASFGPSSGTVNFTIAKAPVTVSGGTGTPVQYGASAQITSGIVTTSTGVAPTGTFQFFVDSSPIGQPVGLYESSGYIATSSIPYAWAEAISETTFLSIGSHTIYEQYSGDANYAATSSPTQSFQVTQATPDISGWGVVNPMGSPVIIGQNATAIATVFGSQHGSPPTGAVTFYDGGVALSGTVTYTSTNPIYNAEGSLSANLITVFSTPGTHLISVSYSGDANYTSATTPTPQSLSVLGPVSVTPAGSVTVASPGQAGSTSLSVTPNAGFLGAASLACTPDPKATETTCSLTSGSSSGSTVQVNVSGTGLNVTLNVTTTAAHQVGMQKAPRLRSGPALILACLLVVFLPRLKHSRRHWFCIIALALTLSIGACGGGGSAGGGGAGGGGTTEDYGTTPGTYTFPVTATTGSGASSVTANTQVSVIVIQ